MTTSSISKSNKPGPVARRAGPGRPEGGDNNVRESILDAAEVEFADRGYAGTTLREIAQAVNVTQALISYYFGSKFGLFEAVFLRRSRKVSDARVDGLKALRSASSVPDIRSIVLAFLTPTLSLRATPGGRAFIRLQARLHTEPPEISYKLRNDAYDVSTKLFVEAISEALPELSKKDVYWRVTLMIGSYMYGFSDTHRLEEIAGDVCDLNDSEEILAQICDFVVGGLTTKSRKT